MQKMQVWALLSATLILVLDCFQENLFIIYTCVHVWILNKLPSMDNANEYDLNYAIVYYTKCK